MQVRQIAALNLSTKDAFADNMYLTETRENVITHLWPKPGCCFENWDMRRKETTQHNRFVFYLLLKVVRACNKMVLLTLHSNFPLFTTWKTTDIINTLFGQLRLKNLLHNYFIVSVRIKIQIFIDIHKLLQ